jgi:hypothetical protein
MPGWADLGRPTSAMTPETCPNCGADVPPKARCCPECGADEKTGWSDEADTGHLDLPDGPFDYDDFVKREFGGGAARPRGISWLWWATAALLLIAGLYLLQGWR